MEKEASAMSAGKKRAVGVFKYINLFWQRKNMGCLKCVALFLVSIVHHCRNKILYCSCSIYKDFHAFSLSLSLSLDV